MMSNEANAFVREVAKPAYDSAFKGISKVAVFDAPDYANVGDSAIFLGLMTYFRMANIQVEKVFSRGTLPHDISKFQTIVFMGGGSFGGLSPESDEQRIFVAKKASKTQRIIQCPQSIEFISIEAQEELRLKLGNLENFRFMIRDNSSWVKTEGWTCERTLAPDAFHFLGSRVSQAHSGAIAYLVREDQEATSKSDDSIDKIWLKDEFSLLVARKARLLGRYFEFLARALNPSPERWERIAAQRMRRGIAALADSEVVVTDRLHGMLISLNVGKKVVFFDNTNKKLSSYVSTWSFYKETLIQASDLEDARARAASIASRPSQKA